MLCSSVDCLTLEVCHTKSSNLTCALTVHPPTAVHAQEVLDNVQPEAGALTEAYNDAVYFK